MGDSRGRASGIIEDLWLGPALSSLTDKALLSYANSWAPSMTAEGSKLVKPRSGCGSFSGPAKGKRAHS